MLGWRGLSVLLLAGVTPLNRSDISQLFSHLTDQMSLTVKYYIFKAFILIFWMQLVSEVRGEDLVPDFPL